MSTIIQLNNIKKAYGNKLVLNVPELSIPEGECFGLVGNNGAGKTTMFSLFLDLIRATEGNVTSKGTDVHASMEWKKYTGAYLDEGFLIDFLLPEEYFKFIAKMRGMTEGDVDTFLANYEEFFAGEVLGKGKYIRDLSKGNQKKVGIAAAMMGDPDVLILDEPFANLDPSTQIRLKNLLKQLKDDRKVTLLVSSHDLSHVTEVCERIVVLHKGKITKDIRTNAETLKELESFFTA